MCNIGMTCDVCGRKVSGITYVNGMGFCAKCYQETFGDKNERNLNVEMATEMVKLAEENEQLKEQLAEKDKEIKSLEQEIENNQRDYVSELAYYTAEENVKEIRKQMCDKIKEKLKAHCDYTDEENIGWYLTEHKIDTLLDQIEQAKENIDND